MLHRGKLLRGRLFSTKLLAFYNRIVRLVTPLGRVFIIGRDQ